MTENDQIEIIRWIDTKKQNPNSPGWYLVRGREYGDARINNPVFETAVAHYIDGSWTADLSLCFSRECFPASLVVDFWAELPKGPAPELELIPYETNS